MEPLIFSAFTQESATARIIYVPSKTFNPSKLPGLTTHYVKIGSEVECYIRSECDPHLYNLALSNVTINRTFNEWCAIAELDPALVHPKYNSAISTTDIANKKQPVDHPDGNVVMCFRNWATLMFSQLLRTKERYIDHDIAKAKPRILKTPVDLKEHMITLFCDHVNAFSPKYDAFKQKFIEKMLKLNRNVTLNAFKNEIGMLILGRKLLNPIPKEAIITITNIVDAYLAHRTNPDLAVLAEEMAKTKLYTQIDLRLRMLETERIPWRTTDGYHQALVHAWKSEDAIGHLDVSMRSALVEFNSQVYTKITAMELELVEYNKLKTEIEKENAYILQVQQAIQARNLWRDVLYCAFERGSRKYYRFFLNGLICLLN